MCSWCWGFSSVIEQLRVDYADSFDASLVLGGLAPATREPLDDYRKDEIRSHWRHVTELSGQTFDQAFFERESFIYNTEPPCRAVVVMRGDEPGREFEFLRRLHEAFYAQNRDITDRETLGDIAAQCGSERETFLVTFDDPKTGLVRCPTINIHNSLVFFVPGGVARPCVEPATKRPRVLPVTKNPVRLIEAYCGTTH